MIRYIRVSDRYGPIAPIRRLEPFRQEEPAEREWVRMLFDSPQAERKSKAYFSLVPDVPAAPLYDESGKLRDLNVLEVGIQMDVMT